MNISFPRFPQVFDVLSNHSPEVLKVSDVFPDNEKYVDTKLTLFILNSSISS